MIESPVFWIIAVISVLITGVSKGGFGGLALLAVPLMALTISPLQAAGIMLPILIVMDWVSVWSYRKHWNKSVLLLTLPGAILGIIAAWQFAAYVNDQFVRICVGMIAVCFPVYSVFKLTRKKTARSQDVNEEAHKDANTETGGAPVKPVRGNKPLGFISGTVAGFTSFIAHAGGPPFQAYAIPLGMDKRIYAGTAVMFFCVVNFIKLVPYAMLGQFDRTNLTISLMLIPLAPVGVLMGVWLVKRMDQNKFYGVLYAIIFAVGVKLLWDGLA